MINVDYYTSAITQDEFNGVKQQLNMDVLRLLENLEITIAGASTDIHLTAGSTLPTSPDHPNS